MPLRKIALWTKGDTLTSIAQDIVERKGARHEASFYLMNLDDVCYKIDLWKKTLPRVQPHYAVKCNGDVAILRTLADRGVNFDCATKREIELVLSLGVAPNRIVYAHTIKNPSYIRYAKYNHVARMTFDNTSELIKIKENFPGAELVLRLRVVEDDMYHMCDKFGCVPNNAIKLLEKAKDLDLNVIGLSFHVGCNNQTPNAYRNALAECKRVEKLATAFGYDIKLIDIGGGYQGQIGTERSFLKTADEIQKSIDEFFPEEGHYKIISEPGTFFVASSMVLAAKVVGKRILNGIVQLYINDSTYMSFMLSFFDDSHLNIQLLGDKFLHSIRAEGDDLFPTRVWGNTCDGVDVIAKLWHLPHVSVGDWLLFHNMGAYSVVTETEFNSFEHPQIYYRASDTQLLQRAREALYGASTKNREVEDESLAKMFHRSRSVTDSSYINLPRSIA